jgi:phosphatidylinositol alpha-mannosyltransferase
VTDDALCDLLAGADVVCAPSLWGESFGLVLVEAMAAGVPVVASDLPGYADVVGTRAGLLTPPEDAVAVAHSLHAVLSDRARRRRMAIAARRRARRFDWDRIGPRVLAVYARAMAGSA